MGPAAQLLAETQTSGSQVSRMVSAGRLRSPVWALSCTPFSSLHAHMRARTPDSHAASALPALWAARGAPGIHSFTSTALARAGSCDLLVHFA